MPIIQKRMKKYFGGKENEGGTKLADLTTNDFADSELLRTIKLSKNLFKMKLPKADYEAPFNTLPGPKIKSRAQQSNNRTVSNATDGSEDIDTKKSALPRISKQKPATDAEGTDGETKVTISNKRGEASVEGPRISGDKNKRESKGGERTPAANRNVIQELSGSQSEARVKRTLNREGSVNSLHEPQSQKRKNSRIQNPPISEYDEYADEVKTVTRPSDSSKGKVKRTINEQQEVLANKIHEKRQPRILES